MSILAPTPFLGWNPVFKGKVRHFAISAALDLKTSPDGDTFKDTPIGGDLRYDTAFQPATRITFMGLIIIAGGLNGRAALYTSAITDGVRWKKRLTGLEGDAAAKEIVWLAANNDYVVALTRSGKIAVSLDGLAWAAHANIGFTGTDPARTIAASSTGFAAGGINGQLRTIDGDPRGSWVARDSKFGSETINVLVAGNVFGAFGTIGKISTCPLNNLATWTARTSGLTEVDISFAVYATGKWFAASIAQWITSINGDTWTDPGNDPREGGSVSPAGRIENWYLADGLIYLHWGQGNLSRGDGSTWEVVEPSGLSAGQTYKASGFLG